MMIFWLFFALILLDLTVTNVQADHGDTSNNKRRWVYMPMDLVSDVGGLNGLNVNDCSHICQSWGVSGWASGDALSWDGKKADPIGEGWDCDQNVPQTEFGKFFNPQFNNGRASSHLCNRDTANYVNYPIIELYGDDTCWHYDHTSSVTCTLKNDVGYAVRGGTVYPTADAARICPCSYTAPTKSPTNYPTKSPTNPPTMFPLCVGSYACKDETQTCPASASCAVTCSGYDACRNMDMTCAAAEDCAVTCEGQNACDESDMTCAAGKDCAVTCDGSSCWDMDLDGRTASSLTVTTSGSDNYTAMKITVLCPRKTAVGNDPFGAGGDCVVTCGGSGYNVCRDMSIDARDQGSAFLLAVRCDCTGSNCCYSATVDPCPSDKSLASAGVGNTACPAPGLKVLTSGDTVIYCPVGFYCPDGTQPVACPDGSYCPAGSASPTAITPVANFTELQSAIEAQNQAIKITESFNATEQIVIDYNVWIEGNNNILTGDGSSRFVQVVSGGTLTIQNITLKDGAVSTGVDGPYDEGGAILVLWGRTLKATNVRFYNNTARVGGGVSVNMGSATFTTCTFESNFAEFGGGVYLTSSSTATFDTCTFEKNSAAAPGGAMLIDSSKTTFIGVQTWGNYGIGVCTGSEQIDNDQCNTCYDSQYNCPTLTHSPTARPTSPTATPTATPTAFPTGTPTTAFPTGTPTTATPTVSEIFVSVFDDGLGGGLKEAVNARIPKITITANIAATEELYINYDVLIEGGNFEITRADTTGVCSAASVPESCHRFFRATNGTLTIKDLTLKDGAVSSKTLIEQGGGAISVKDGGTLKATNVRFYNNTGRNGGGVEVDGSAAFDTCTFASNEVFSDGGGVLVRGTATFQSCVFDSNTAWYGGGVLVTTGTEYGGGVLVTTGTATFTSTNFTSNSANDGGGGVKVSSGTARFYNTEWNTEGSTGGCAVSNAHCNTCMNCQGKDKCAHTCVQVWDLDGGTTKPCSCATATTYCKSTKGEDFYCNHAGTCSSGRKDLSKRCGSGCNSECKSDHCSEYNECISADTPPSETAGLTNVTYTCLAIQEEYNKGCCDTPTGDGEISLRRFTAAPTATPTAAPSASPTASPSTTPTASPTKAAFPLCVGGVNPCAQERQTCPASASCAVTCSGSNACFSMDMTCAAAEECSVECSGYYACRNMDLDGTTASSLTVTTSGSDKYTGQYMSVLCPLASTSGAQYTGGDCAVTCGGSGDGVCWEMSIDARDQVSAFLLAVRCDCTGGYGCCYSANVNPCPSDNSLGDAGAGNTACPATYPGSQALSSGDTVISPTMAPTATPSATPTDAPTVSEISVSVFDDGGGLKEAVNAQFPTITITESFSATAEIVINYDVLIQGGGFTLSGGGSNRFFNVASGATLTIQDLTLTGGYVVGIPYPDIGGAILVEGSLVAKRLNFTSNEAYDGGGVFVDGTATFESCAFESNSATSSGGGVYVWETATATFNTCTFHGLNKVQNGVGGGVRVYGTATFYNTAWKDCTGYYCNTCYNCANEQKTCDANCLFDWDLNPVTADTDPCAVMNCSDNDDLNVWTQSFPNELPCGCY